MNKIAVISLLFHFIVLTNAFADAIGKTEATGKADCQLWLSGSPVEYPEMVETPDEVVPKPEVVPEVPPKPREAPNPFPKREPRPTDDPKDIVPIDLYTQDPGMERFWSSLPEDVKAQFARQSYEDLEILSKAYIARYGKPPSLSDLSSNVTQLTPALREVESKHKAAVEILVRSLAERRFGFATMQLLESGISDQLPPRSEPTAKQEQAPKSELESPIHPSTLNFFIFRREMYNLIVQAEGWDGMHEFVEGGKPDVDAIDPTLSSIYRDLDLNYRLANILVLAQVPHAQYLQGPQRRDNITAGREIVSVKFRPKEGITGQKMFEIADVSGVAVGANGWALSHEAFKAAAQISTALEASQRAPLTDSERQELDNHTNSNIAEIRQGIFGSIIKQRMERFIFAMLKTKDPELYFRTLERVFSYLGQNQFREFILDAFRFDPEKMNADPFRIKYNESLLLDEMRTSR